MATVNKRLKKPQALVINGVDVGGVMTAVIQQGYDNSLSSAPDGLQLPVIDREIEFTRGTVTTQDWVHAIDLLTGTVGTYVFYERKSGVAAATGYVLYTITAPVIHNVSLTLSKGGYMTCTFAFECRAADESKGIADMLTITDTQAAPTDIASARGGYRVTGTTHGTGLDEIVVYHLNAFNFSLAMPVVKACNDSDIGYTCVDAELTGMAASGSIGFQDGEITTSLLKAQNLLTADPATLVLTVTQGQGATAKTITIANADFSGFGSQSDASAPFTGFSADFDVANDAGTPLTLEGTNKIIVIADVV
jgi:hypothetical protein